MRKDPVSQSLPAHPPMPSLCLLLVLQTRAGGYFGVEILDSVRLSDRLVSQGSPYMQYPDNDKGR